MLAIRLRRMGSKKRPSYRLVVAEARYPRDGRFVEVIGHYNPRSQPEQVDIDRARLEHWLSVGARPSDTVRTLMARHPARPEVRAEEPAATASAPAAGASPPPVESGEGAAPAPSVSGEESTGS
jgi:small subunit ribosomal protein S16